MAPKTMAKRSIAHRPVDKISQLFYYCPEHKPKETSYLCSFQPADLGTYVVGPNRPVIDGYYTHVKHVIEQDGCDEKIGTPSKISHLRIGEQKNLGTVKNLHEMKRRTHGVVTTSDTDIRRIMFPGNDDDEEEEKFSPSYEDVAQLRSRTHGAKSNSDRTGDRTKKALKYESCSEDGGTRGNDTQIQRKRVTHERPPKCEMKSFNRKTNFISNLDFNDKFLSLQEAIQYLNKIRSALIKKDKSLIDTCRKTASFITSATDGIEMLVSKSSIVVEYSKLEPVIDMLNLKTLNQTNVNTFWDLFDHQIPLSEFKFGRLVPIFPEEPVLNDVPVAKPKQSNEKQDRLERRLKARQFKDFDTAGDLISPKPGTPFGLGHVDYFLPRVSEDIKTIFRNFDLDERTFEDAWREARKLETCKMSKVSAENFRKVVHQKGVRLLSS